MEEDPNECFSEACGALINPFKIKKKHKQTNEKHSCAPRSIIGVATLFHVNQ